MKLNKIMMAAVLACGTATFAYAAAEPNQGSGDINFKGEVIEAPCSVAQQSAGQLVEMGQVNNKVLKKAGKSSPQTFDISLVDCDLEAIKGVTVAFSGTQDTINTDLLRLVGTVSGAGIGIEDANGKTVKLGTKSEAIALTDGNNTLKFAAYLQGNSTSASAVITPGEFTSVAHFKLAYE